MLRNTAALPPTYAHAPRAGDANRDPAYLTAAVLAGLPIVYSMLVSPGGSLPGEGQGSRSVRAFWQLSTLSAHCPPLAFGLPGRAMPRA